MKTTKKNKKVDIADAMKEFNEEHVIRTIILIGKDGALETISFSKVNTK